MANWVALVDPGTLFLLCVAPILNWYGCKLSLGGGKTVNQVFKEEEQLQWTTVILMPIVGSIFLILLFYFLDKIQLLLIIFVSIVALVHSSFVLSYWIGNLMRDRDPEYQVKWVGLVSLSSIISIVIALALVLTWALVSQKSNALSVVLTDVLACFMAIASICLIRIPNLKIASIMLWLFFFYDIFWVFLSSFIFKKSVMVSVATRLPSLPMVILSPRFFVEGFSLLGLGDIVLPGVFICFLAHFDRSNANTTKSRYFLMGMIGYIIGLFMAYFIVVASNTGQPALLYLVPLTLGPTYFFGWKRGEFKELWLGKQSEPYSQLMNEEDEESPV